MNPTNFAILFLASFVTLLLQESASAQFVSENGDSRLSWLRSHEKSCVSGEAQGSYSLSTGNKGLLYPTDCNSPSKGGDLGLYRFIDTSGSERCAGSMDMFFLEGRKINTTWRVTNPAPGHSCRSIGKVYELRLRWSRSQ
jgi:hypothetical protein